MDLMEHQAARGLLEGHLYAYSRRVVGESRAAQEKLLIRGVSLLTERYKSETHRLVFVGLEPSLIVCQASNLSLELRLKNTS